MHNKKYLIMITLMVVILSGYFIYSFNAENKEGIPYITEIRIPEGVPGLENMEDFSSFRIVYKNDESREIEVVFNKNVENLDFEQICFFQFGNYIPIDKSSDSDAYYVYRVEDNMLSIYPSETKKHYPMGAISLYIPAMNSDGVRFMDKDAFLFFSPNTLKPVALSKLEHVNIDRKEKSLILNKKKDDGQEIAYVNNENAVLYSNEYFEKPVFNLCRGENVRIVATLEEVYRVELYFPKSYDSEYMGIDENIYDKKYVDIVEGYIEKENLTLLPEPLNDETIYSVRLFDENQTAELFMCIYPETYGSYMLKIDGDIKRLNDIIIGFCEGISTFTWSSMLPGDRYWCTYGDGEGGIYSKFDKEAHMPEYEWSQKDYSAYEKAYDMYIDYQKNKITDLKVLSELEEYKVELLNEFVDRSILQQIWIDWGYYNLKDENYFFNEILNRFDLTEDERDNYSELFIFEKSENKDFDFNNKLKSFTNTRNNLGDYVEFVDREVESYVTNHYSMGCTVVDVHPDDLNPDGSLKDDTFQDIEYDIRLTGVIKKIISKEEIIVTYDKDNQDYKVLIDVPKGGPDLYEGVRTKVNGWYSDDVDENGNPIILSEGGLIRIFE